ncbi:MAG: hypothetical protein CMO44_17440 [Verrucomicrobiales bacterium]|nr:hypothetical protein [Verrucomicrobiales bacterium]
MPKYIKKRRGPKPKLHKVIQGIEHKQCTGSCKKFKPLDQFGKNGYARRSDCKACVKKKVKQRLEVYLEKRKQAREAAPPGFLVCLFHGCKKGLQPLDQFLSPFVRNNEPTMRCLTCRNKSKEDREQRYTACQKVYHDWRKTHWCVKCTNDPNYEHNYLLIEADHLGKKLKACSNHAYWSTSKRGPAALRAELMTVQALCKFHHRLQTQQRNHENGRIQTIRNRLRKRKIINAEKHKRGCCFLCKRVLKEGEECAFDFDHRDPTTKFIRNGKLLGPTSFVRLPQALFDKQWPLEQAKCDLLCANCHKLKTFANRDSYKNKTNKF